jgi:tetratricopeptide (TPR) repeat protein
MEPAEARLVWKQTIWRLRKFRRWSQDRFALELQNTNASVSYGIPRKREHIVRAIQHWEAGDVLPSDEYSVLAVIAFALPEELNDGTLTPGSDLDQLMAAYQEMGYTMDRRRFILGAAALAVAGRDAFAGWNMDSAERLDYALRHPRSADIAVVTHLRERVRDLNARYDQAPSTSLLPAAGQHLSQVAYLRQHARDGHVQRGLCAIEAQSATLMGQLVWDASQRRDHATSNAYYDQAARAANHIGDQTAEAYALLRKSFVALYGVKDPRQGLVLAQQAATLAANGTSHALEGLGLLHVGEAFAMVGERRDCEKAIEAAESRFGRVEPTDPAYHIFSPDQLGRMTGSCYLYLGDAEKAQPILESTARSLRDRQKSRAIVLGNLALAHIRQGNLDEAAAVLRQAIDLVERTRGGGALNVLFTAGREFRPWQHEPIVEDVRDRLLTLIAAV